MTTVCSVRVALRDGSAPPTGYSGQERACGTFIDRVTRKAFDADLRIQMDVAAGTDRLAGARLLAYGRFAVNMEKLDGLMTRDFDYRVLMETEKPS